MQRLWDIAHLLCAWFERLLRVYDEEVALAELPV